MDKSHIYIRSLTPEDWEEFRSIRIRSLTMHAGYFLGKLDEVNELPDEYWKETLDGNGKQVFGLFDKNVLIGITAIFTWLEDPTGKTGVMAMSFIEPPYRNKGYSNFFYKARIDYAKNNSKWDKLVIGHREGNEPVRKAVIKYGFEFLDTENIDWPDGTLDIEYRYELDLTRFRLP